MRQTYNYSKENLETRGGITHDPYTTDWFNKMETADSLDGGQMVRGSNKEPEVVAVVLDTAHAPERELEMAQVDQVLISVFASGTVAS